MKTHYTWKQLCDSELQSEYKITVFQDVRMRRKVDRV
jgi:hypothetical protein